MAGTYEHGGTAIAWCIAPYYVNGEPNRVNFWIGNMPFMPDEDILIRIIDNNGRIMVDVLADGRVELGDAYDPDVTARRFWASLMWFIEQERGR